MMASARGTTGEAVNGQKEPVWIAIYARKSNDENLTGEVTSLDAQTNSCRGYIQIQREKGWKEYAELFQDPNESGGDLRRPAMKRLLKAVAEKRVHGVIVYKLDRLTRNRRDFDDLLELFERQNVALISATEAIDTKSPQGRLMVSMLMQFAQYSRELDQERSKDFHLARARKGLWCGGLPPLGYDAKDKLLVVNEEEARLVRRVFELYLKHKSTFAVAEELNRLGFQRKAYKTEKGRIFGGKGFDPDSVIRVLQRKVYVGVILNERTGLEFPGQQPPIVSKEVFEAAQALLRAHNRRDGTVAVGSNRHGFLLKGLIRCGRCQSAMVSYAQPKKDKVYCYYKCIAKVNGLPVKCSVGSLGARKIEEYLIEKLAAVGYDRVLLERVVAKVGELSRKQLGPLEEERREVAARVAALDQQSTNLLRLAAGEGASETAKKELRRLETAKGALEMRLGELEGKIRHRRQAVYDVDVIQAALQRFASFVYKIPVDLRVQLIGLVVKQVNVYSDRLRVELHELPIADLQRVLDVKTARDARKFKSRRSLERRDLTITGGSGTAVMESGKTGGADGTRTRDLCLDRAAC
jgi:site-specific DNA recombinase